MWKMKYTNEIYYISHTNMPKGLTRLRRSTRHGRRKSTRIKTKKKPQQISKSGLCDLYDRDMGGYKFLPLHKDSKWHRTKREKTQIANEDNMCNRMKSNTKVLDKEGYAMDNFFVSEDTGESLPKEDTDDLFDRADANSCSSSSEDDSSEDERWGGFF